MQKNTQTPVAITVTNVRKDFLLPHERVQSVKSAFVRLFRRRKRTVEVQHALRGINLQIKQGEFFGILGRNGSGKSTLLKILAGIYMPTKGRVAVTGRLVPFIELGVGFNPELTGRENVYLNGALLGFSKVEMDSQYDRIVEFAELQDFMDQKLKNYSSGMQVRLAFSVAIIADADILLVDEVLAVGDADFQRKCFQYFKSLKKNKKTVVFVSHDMNAVREYCDRAVLIKDSRIHAEGKAEKITQEYLRLFNENTQEDEVELVASEGENRWGNKWAHYTKVNHALTDDMLTLQLRVRADKDLSDVVYGFRIRNGAGEEVVGTNSQIIGQQSLELRKGQTIDLTWQVPNIFSNGAYVIEPALVLGDGATVCDWWNEAQKFTVLKQHSTSYPVTPTIKFEVKG